MCTFCTIARSWNILFSSTAIALYIFFPSRSPQAAKCELLLARHSIIVAVVVVIVVWPLELLIGIAVLIVDPTAKLPTSPRRNAPTPGRMESTHFIVVVEIVVAVVLFLVDNEFIIPDFIKKFTLIIDLEFFVRHTNELLLLRGLHGISTTKTTELLAGIGVLLVNPTAIHAGAKNAPTLARMESTRFDVVVEIVVVFVLFVD
jgi:hypothetical protein